VELRNGDEDGGDAIPVAIFSTSEVSQFPNRNSKRTFFAKRAVYSEGGGESELVQIGSNAMERWDPEIERCFNADRKFGATEVEREVAFAWLRSLRQRKVSWKEVKKQIVDYLTSKGADRDLLTDQTKRARKRLKPWLASS
jgi:hypothetical protein